MLLSIRFQLHHFCTLTMIRVISTSLLATVPVYAQSSYAQPSYIQSPYTQLSHAIPSPTVSERLLADRLSQAPSPASPLQSSTWQSFTAASGHYAVDLPTSPTQFTSTTEVPEGTLTWQVAETRLQAIEADSPNAADSPNTYEYYMIAYTTLSADHLNNRNPDELVQSISDAVLAEGELTGNIQLEEPILFHNYPARLIIGAVNDQYWVMIVSLVNGRIYTNLTFSAQRDRMIHFFDSFVFTDSSSQR